ncbi:unnamed protein product, partial [Ascophyllum nodosum]
QVTLRSVFRIQNCTDHVVMLYSHPNRTQQPPRPRVTGRVERRDPASNNDGGVFDHSVGASQSGVSAASQGFLGGGNAFFPGASSCASSFAHPGQERGESGRFSGGSSGGVEGDFTLLEPGKVFHLPLLLLQEALELEKGAALGYVWLRPAAAVPFMTPPHVEEGSHEVMFSSSPIKLHRLVTWGGGTAPAGD